MTDTVKRVSFGTTEVIYISDDEEYINSRCGHWEEVARDAARFQRRISETANKLEWILLPSHRAKIMKMND
jgi:hypothetical protein